VSLVLCAVVSVEISDDDEGEASIELSRLEEVEGVLTNLMAIQRPLFDLNASPSVNTTALFFVSQRLICSDVSC